MCGSAFFSIYQFEILTYFSLSKNILKKKKEIEKKKWGAGICGRVDWQKIGLIR